LILHLLPGILLDLGLLGAAVAGAELGATAGTIAW